jgi:hypothetical protein
MNITVTTPDLFDMIFMLIALRNFEEKFMGCVSLVETLHLSISAYQSAFNWPSTFDIAHFQSSNEKHVE